jgi:hypothetical protein
VKNTLHKADAIIVEDNDSPENGRTSSSKDLGKVLLKWTNDNPANAITSEFQIVSSNDIDFDLIFGRGSIIQHNLPGKGLSNPMILKATKWIHPTR